MPLNFCIEHENVAKFDIKSIWFSGFVSKKCYYIRQNKGKAVAGHYLFLFTDHRQLSLLHIMQIWFHSKLTFTTLKKISLFSVIIAVSIPSFFFEFKIYDL